MDVPGSPLLVVDAANVVGSVPDGWWRDRLGATERLRDHLARTATTEVLLVVEGRACGVAPVPGVEVVAAAGSGDDEVVAQVASGRADGRSVTVATADRGLRTRVEALGAEVVGPRTVRHGT